MRIIFAGTPDFAVPCLQALIDGPQAGEKHEIVAVYTQPDRPAGRGRKLAASPVKQLAQAHGIDVCQPQSLKTPDSQAELRALRPDLMVVIAYGLILPQAVLDIPRLGCVNVHASLLPRWRGAAPIQRAIEAGDNETGITLMQMDAGLDTGDILLQKPCPITDNETGGSLHDKLAVLGATVLNEGLEALAAGTLSPRPQPQEGVAYAHKLSKAEGRVDWTDRAVNIERRIRAFNPWPVAHAQLEGETLRLWDAAAIGVPAAAAPGSILRASAEGIDVACGDRRLRILKLQWPGGRPLSAAQAGHGRDLAGKRFE